MSSTYNENKSVIAERFIKTLKVKIYKKMTGNNSKYCLIYLNNLIDQYNNACYSINKKTVQVDYSDLTEKN